eukprot:SM000028S10047  [mRNA]  locus=s28:87759:89162:- [translate_table: standard]
MAAAGAASYRDRTSELFQVAERLKKAQGSAATASASAANGAADGARGAAKGLATPQTSAGSQSEFNRRASRIGLSIHQTSQKLAKLAKLAKRTSMFDDPAVEIQELTAVIKQDITALNEAISQLQALSDSRTDSHARNKHSSEHSTTVVDNLKSRLMSTTKEFKDNLKVHEGRRQLFSAAPPVHDGHRPSPFARQRPVLGNGQAPGFRQMQQQLVVPGQDSYMASRTEALQNVESTIVELSSIFTQLATMVAQQGEVAIRIDENMDDTLANVEGAQGALLKYLNRISSNRWLVIKIFFVLMVFLLIFVVFIA